VKGAVAQPTDCCHFWFPMRKMVDCKQDSTTVEIHFLTLGVCVPDRMGKGIGKTG
jgi:hypothetical protein